MAPHRPLHADPEVVIYLAGEKDKQEDSKRADLDKKAPNRSKLHIQNAYVPVALVTKETIDPLLASVHDKVKLVIIAGKKEATVETLQAMDGARERYLGEDTLILQVASSTVKDLMAVLEENADRIAEKLPHVRVEQKGVHTKKVA